MKNVLSSNNMAAWHCILQAYMNWSHGLEPWIGAVMWILGVGSWSGNVEGNFGVKQKNAILVVKNLQQFKWYSDIFSKDQNNVLKVLMAFLMIDKMFMQLTLVLRWRSLHRDKLYPRN